MSLGFSLSDVKFAFDLGKSIYEKCFTKANRARRPFLSTLEYSQDGAILLTMCELCIDVRYFEFGEDIQTLAQSLQQLIEVTENAGRQRQDAQRGPEAELRSLREVTGDFGRTLRDCNALLGNHHKFHRNKADFVDNVVWHASTESEISNLKERVRLHITKMSFVIKPFEIQLLVGIRNELIQLQQEVRDLAGLVITLRKDTTRDSALPSLPSIEMPLISDAITQRFVAALKLNKPDAFHTVSDFPLKEGFDALAFHFAKSTILFNPGIGPSQKVPKETQYLNLLKAKWILEKLKASSRLAAAETNSLWLNCEREVEQKIVEQCRRFQTDSLKPPPLENITRLPDDCFTIWIFEAPPLQPHLAEARALEEKILDLTLPNNSTLTIFRSSDDDFRVVTVHTTVIPDRSKEVERESFSANMQSTQLVPAYAIPEPISGSSLSGNGILLYRAQDLSQWQPLKDLMDVFSFQQALTGYRVFFDASNVTWSLNGSDKPGKHGVARIQFWEAKRLTKLPIAEDTDQSPLSSVNSTTPGSPQTLSENGFGKRRLTGLASTINSSTRTTQISGNRACNAIVIQPPEPPVLIIYTLCDSKFTFLHLTLGEEIFVNESACLCKRSPEKCLRIVLNSKKKKIKLRKHSALEPDSRGLHSWDLARFRIPRHPRYKEIEVVEKDYLCLDFKTKPAKAEFRNELRSLFKYVRDPDIQDYRMEIKKLEHNSHRPGSRLFS